MGCALGLTALLGSFSPAWAEEEARTVVVAPPVSGPAFDRERTVHTLDAEALLAGQPTDGVDAAAWVPGVTLQRTNRGAGTPLIRGFAGPQNLVIVDDVRFDLSTFRTGPNQYAALVDPLGLGAVEVTLGPGSVLWGTGAMGGVLRYRTPGLRDADGFGGQALGRFATADTGGAAAMQLNGRAGPVAGWIGGAYRHHGALRTGAGTHVPMSAYGASSWRGKVGVDLGADWTLTSAYLATRTRDAGRTDKLGRGEVRVYDNDDHLTYLALARRARGSWLRDLRLTLSYHRLWDQVERSNCARRADGSPVDRAGCVARNPGTVTRTRQNTDVVDAVGARASAKMRFLDELLVLHAGLEGRFESVDSAGADSSKSGPVRGTFSDGSTFAGFDAFAMVEGRPYVDAGSLELVVTGGARLSTVFAHAADVPGLGTVDFQTLAPAFSGGVRALIGNRINIFATFHEGVRAPNLQETTALGDTGNFFEVPNGDLGPERADSLEVGVRAHLPWLRVEGAYFHTWLSDAIVRQEVEDGAVLYPEAEDATVMQRVNAERAEIDGLEVGLQTGAVWGLSLFGDVAWLQSDVVRADGSREPGRRIPPIQGTVGLRWDGASHGAVVALALRWAAAQERLSSGDRKDLRICEDPDRPGVSLGDACTGTPGWAAVDLRAGLDVRPDLRFETRVSNLTDAHFRRHGSGFDAAGLDVRMSLRQTF